MNQLDRMEEKLDILGTRLAAVENWKAEMDGVMKTVKVAWTLFAAVAAIAGWLIAHYGVLGLRS